MPDNVAVVIPARYGSTRFPGKPLHEIAGKPLLQHVWELCVRARGIAEVVIATDDMRIAETAFGFGAQVALTSAKHRSGTDRIAEVAKRMRGISHVINVQGDEPLIDPRLITRLARTLLASREMTMLTAATPFARAENVGNPNAVKVVIDRKSDALYFSRSTIPNTSRAAAEAQPSNDSTPHLLHLGIYGYRRDFLLKFVKWKPGRLELLEQLEQLRALENGAKIHVLITKARSTGVDTPEDAHAVERMLSSASSPS